MLTTNAVRIDTQDCTKIEDNLFQCRPFTHDILYHDIEVRNGYLYSCSCPDSSKLCKYTFLVNHIIQVPFTGRPRLHVTPATDKNAALSNTTEEMSNNAFGKIQSTSNMDERSLRFSEFINEGEKYCQAK
ncbi:uncharacterized protein RHIMIDRAFT_287916 [Rhizopus microsporus ATCC 52813]|uniref:SWIM-type domain-containing protein n=1 Tax=Rhizopus microsporus ATCC 52813 TaxID=1340429 RepID=A0A2G4T7B4_RHIZD|nr:uncharacterized protein RHIMIDRAFT_287916 [Rhizopus microsporus ATCC 52813]PHZ16897.1 hypothetical protein RHIMIDRAFT_287916 [Rhizopus microsporus ATCC 52813]